MSLVMETAPETQAEGGDGTPPNRLQTANGLLEPGEGHHDDLSHDPNQVGVNAQFDQIAAAEREASKEEFDAIVNTPDNQDLAQAGAEVVAEHEETSALGETDPAEAGRRIIESTTAAPHEYKPVLTPLNSPDQAPETPPTPPEDPASPDALKPAA